MYSLVISTIGCPFLLDSLASLTYPPDDVIVVLDRIGRKASTLDEAYPLPRLRYEMRNRFPSVRLLYTNPLAPWAVMNQCYNIGWRRARNPFVLFTHDDIEWPDFDFPSHIDAYLASLTDCDHVNGKRVVGLVLPEYEVANGVMVPDYPPGTFGLTQCISPVSQIVSVQAMREMGGFDEVDGVWYDGQLEAESHIRDWWYLTVRTPPIRHTSNRTYRANNWGNAWAANPIWGNYQQNYERRYGSKFVRTVAPPVIPLTDAPLC